MVKPCFAYLFLVFLVISCHQTDQKGKAGIYSDTPIVLAKEEYIIWCRKKDSPLQKTKEIADITYSLKYKPAAFIACIEQEEDKAKPADFEKNIQELDGLDYYDFKIQITSGEGELLKYQVASPTDYDQRVNYFAFGMEKDICMVDGRDTLKCVLFHFERAYDVVPYATFLLAFPKSKSPLTEKTFIYNDRVFDKGRIKITYTPEELSQIPKLQAI